MRSAHVGERVVLESAPASAGQKLRAACSKFAGIGMIVDVADEQDAGRAFLLRRERLAPRGGGLGGDDAFERALRIALAGLVIEHQHDLAAHVVLVVVVVPFGAMMPKPAKTTLRRDAAGAR